MIWQKEKENQNQAVKAVRVANVEKHLQTVLAAIVLGLVTWTGYSITSMQAGVIRTEERLLALTQTINELKTQSREGMQTVDIKFEAMQRKIDAMEKRLYRIEEVVKPKQEKEH